MSTRCQILFTNRDVSLLTYKHHDGYPEGAIPLLREFWHWYPRTKHLEYLTATWFYFCKRQYEERSKELDLWDDPMKMNELNTNHPVALSYGICADEEIHGDIEHFYEVDIEGVKSDFCSPDELEETLGEIISDSDESDSEEKIRLDVEHGYVQYLQVYDHDRVPFEAVVDELRGSMTVERNRTNYNLGDL